MAAVDTPVVRAAPPSRQAHRELRVTRLGSLAFVTPVGPDGTNTPAGPSLSVDLGHGAVGLADMSGGGSLPGLSGGSPPLTAWAVIGVARLPAGAALALVTRAARAGTLRGSPVYRVTGTAVLGPPGPDADSARYVRLLRRALDPRGAGGGLYFSPGADLTLSTQAALGAQGGGGGEAAPPPPLHAAADKRFFWNAALAGPLLESEIASHPAFSPFIVPFIQGFFGQVGPVTLTGGADPAVPDASVCLTVVARRAPARAGVRHWRRGADAGGAVANFVETEQVVEVTPAWGGGGGDAASRPPGPGAWPPGPHTSLSSTVTLRGSIPLLWSQAPDMKYKPRTRVGPPSRADAAFAAHFDGLRGAYPGPAGVLAINLVNAHGSEGALSAAYAAAAVRYAGPGAVVGGEADAHDAPGPPPPLRLVPFDFHAACGATRYDRLDGLWDMIGGGVRSIGSLFLPAADGAAPGRASRQAGVVRINCVDCLDRTNVVQGWLARRALGSALAASRGGDPTAPLASLNPDAEAAFKNLWADHGDALSRQYAGTGALKSGFTRTGKRGLAGLVDDGLKSLARYYLNNFRDGGKQDALDLVTGGFVPDPARPSPFTPQASPALPLLAALVAAVVGVANARAAWGHGGGASAGGGGRKGGGSSSAAVGATAAALSAGALVQTVALPLAAAAGIVWLVFRNGKKFVNRPQLLPEAAAPW